MKKYLLKTATKRSRHSSIATSQRNRICVRLRIVNIYIEHISQVAVHQCLVNLNKLPD